MSELSAQICEQQESLLQSQLRQFKYKQLQHCDSLLDRAICEHENIALARAGNHSRYVSIDKDLYALGKHKKQVILDRYHALSDICIFLEEYKPFKGSVLWQQKLRKVMSRNGGMCEGCKEKLITEVHIQSHANDVDDDYEFRFELLGLCETCHACWHPV